VASALIKNPTDSPIILTANGRSSNMKKYWVMPLKIKRAVASPTLNPLLLRMNI